MLISDKKSVDMLQSKPQTQPRQRAGLLVRSQIRAGYSIEITIPDGLSAQAQMAAAATSPAAPATPAATA